MPASDGTYLPQTSVQNRDIVFRLVFKEWKPSDKDKSLAFAESLLGMRVWLTRPTSAGGLSVQGQLTRLVRPRLTHVKNSATYSRSCQLRIDNFMEDE